MTLGSLKLTSVIKQGGSVQKQVKPDDQRENRNPSRPGDGTIHREEIENI